MCAGDQCCHRSEDGKTFPCPSATPGWSGCESSEKVTNCLTNGIGSNFTEECEAWADGTSPKPTECSPLNKYDGCYKGLPPISAEDGVWCAAGQVCTCNEYCAASGLCPKDFCAFSFQLECEAWVDGSGPKPTTCEGTTTGACYSGLPPISPDKGTFCVDGQIGTCEAYCAAVSTCEDYFCATLIGQRSALGQISTSSFPDRCQAWVDGTGPKPTTCGGTITDGCYKGPPPVSPEDATWCVDGEVSTCEAYCAAVHSCPADFCETSTPTFTAQCDAWADGTGPRPTTCEGTSTDGCYKGRPPLYDADGVFCVNGKISSCKKYCVSAGTCQTRGGPLCQE